MADGPEDALGKVERKGQGEASEGSVHAGAHDDDDADDGREQCPHKGHADAHPTVDEPHVASDDVPAVQSVVHPINVDLGLLEATDGRNASQSRVEQLKHRRFAVTLESLQGSRTIEVPVTDHGAQSQQDHGQGDDIDGCEEGSDADAAER